MTVTGAALSPATMASMAALELDVMPWKVQVSNASTAASDGSDGFQESLREALSPGSSDSDSLRHIIPASAQNQKMPSAMEPMRAGMLSTPSIPPPPGLEIERGADVNIPSKAEPMSSPEGLFDLVQELHQQVSALQSELYTQQAQQAQLMQPMPTLQAMQPSVVPEGVWTSMPVTHSTPFADGVSPLPCWHGYNHVSTGQDPKLTSARSHTLKNGPNALRVRQFCTACGVRVQQSSALFCTSVARGIATGAAGHALGAACLVASEPEAFVWGMLAMAVSGVASAAWICACPPVRELAVSLAYRNSPKDVAEPTRTS